MRRLVLRMSPAMLIVLVAAGLLLGSGREGAARVELVAADGPIALVNSRAGEALLVVSDIAPGGVRSGDVTLANTGTVPGTLALGVTGVTDSPADGSALSSHLQLTLRDRGSGQEWMAPWDSFGPLALGEISPGAARTFTLTVSLPDGDNSLQGAQTRGDLIWTATTLDPRNPPPPEGVPPKPPAEPAPPDGPGQQPPRLRLRFARARLLLRDGVVAFAARCPARCRIAAYALVSGPRMGRLERTRTTIVRSPRAGQLVRVRIRMSSRAIRRVRRLVAHGRRVRIRVVVRVRDDADGRIRRFTHLLTLPRRR